MTGPRAAYDALGAHEQAAVRAEWDASLESAIGRLDLKAEFDAAGDSWVEADAAGHVVIREPGPRPTR